MANLRQWLDGLGFDWETGKIIYQRTKEDFLPGWEKPCDATEISNDDPILTEEFRDIYSGPRCPRIVAKDKSAIFFPVTKSGKTWIERIFHDIDNYLDWNTNESPYIRGK